MTARERVLAAIDHKEPDRVPVDLGATPSSNISAIAYNNLKAYLGMPQGHTRIYDVCQQVIMPEAALLDRFGVDVIDVAQAYCQDAREWVDVTLADGSCAESPAWFDERVQQDGSTLAFLQDGSVGGKMPKGATFFDQTIWPYLDGYPDDYKALPEAMKKVSWQAFAHPPWDHAGGETFWQDLRTRTLALRESTDRALMIVCGCNLFEWGTFLRKIDNFLCDLITDEGEVERLLDALMEVHMATLAKVCDAVGDIVDVIRFGDDLGMDTGPFMRPETYRKLFKPRHAQLCAYVKQHSSMRTFLHTCGSIYKLMPDLIEAGYDILNPVQTSARDMDAVTLKRDFGRDVTFWGGGVDTRHILNHGSPEDVRADVAHRLEIFMPGGGFVFNPIHNIMPDCPPANVVAMFEAVERFGVY